MTTFKYPLKVGEGDTGIAATRDEGFVRLAKQIPLATGTRTIVTFPPKTTIISLQGIITSAIAGDTAASAMKVNFGTSADPAGYGVINVSGDGTGAGAQQHTFTVSGGLLDSGGTMILTASALSTTTYTGGVRAIVHYVVTE